MTARPKLSAAVGWAFAMNWSQRGIGSVVFFVLAALLGPEQFGVVAIASAYVLMTQMVMEQGLAAALIQREDLREEHLSSAFWFLLGLSVLLTGTSVALSGLWASINQLPELKPIITALSFLILLQGLTVVQAALLQREMNFRSLALRSAVSTLIGGAVGIGAALAGAGVWALVGQQLSAAVVGVIVLWSALQWRPRLRFSLAAGRDLFGFSIGTFVARLGSTVNGRLDVLFMGAFFGPAVVGLYRLAYRLMSLVLDMTTRAIQVTAFPQLSRLQNSEEEFRQSLLLGLRGSATLTAPLFALLAVLSEPITDVLGGDWADASDTIRVFALGGFIQAVTLLMGPVLQARGRPFLRAGVVWFLVVADVAALLTAAYFVRGLSEGSQAFGIASFRVAVVVLLLFPAKLYFILHQGRLRLIEILGALRVPALTALATAAAALGLVAISPVIEVSPAGRLLGVGGAAGLAGGVVLVLVDSQIRTFLLVRLRRRWHAVPPGGAG